MQWIVRIGVKRHLFIQAFNSRVPENCRDLWTREKVLTWKNVKNIFICSLHFEAKCFSDGKLRLNEDIKPTLFPDDNVEIEFVLEKDTNVKPKTETCAIKDNGGLFHINKDILKVMKVCEITISEELKSDWKNKNFISDIICVKAKRRSLEMFPGFAVLFHEHSHEVLTKLFFCYTSIRLKHFAKLENEKLKRNRLRKKLSKLIHFSNQ